MTTYRIEDGYLILTDTAEADPRDLYDALEPLTTEGFGWIRPEEIGALTDSPILSDDFERDDSGELTHVGRVFWFPNYQITDPFEELRSGGESRWEMVEMDAYPQRA